MPPPPAWGIPPGPRLSSDRAAEQRALKYLRWAAVVGFVGSLTGLIAVQVLGALNSSGNPLGTSSFSGSAGSTMVSVDATALWQVVAVAIVAIVIEIGSVYLYRASFSSLRGVDTRFSGPTKFSLLLLFGLLLLIPSLIGVAAALQGVSGCALTNSNGTLSPCGSRSIAPLAGSAVLLFVCAIVAVVGLVGLLLGVWRLGVRFDSPLFKVAAILYVIPYIQVVGYLLTWIGARRLEARFATPHYSVPYGGLPPPPPFGPPG
jgi:hypothetical protein